MTFYSIFSKKEIKKQNSPQKNEIINEVIIDIHEKNSLVPSELSKLNIQLKFEPLKVADYLINSVAIERKTISDLKSSIISKRVFSQLAELKQYEKPLLILEGNKEELYNNLVLHENAVRGFILSTSLKFQIPVIFTKNEKETAEYLKLLANKKQDKEISMRASKLALSEKEQIQFILEGFPKIGATTAKKLIEKFKSLKNIFNASKEEISPILHSKTEIFFKILNSSFS